MKTVLMEEMTSPQIRKALDEGYKTVIVAVGSIEQHGKHLPIGMDSMDGGIIAEGIARGLGNALAAPVIRPGCSDHHMSFAGTITFSETLLKEICRAYCESLCRHGFENIVLIASHGGNIKALNEVAPELDAELPCKVVTATILRDPRVKEAEKPILERYDVSQEEGGMHSGFTETSLLLATPYGDLVDMDAAERGFVGDAMARIQEVTKNGKWNIKDISPIGVLGDPTKATADAGEELMDVAMPLYIQCVKEALGWE